MGQGRGGRAGVRMRKSSLTKRFALAGARAYKTFFMLNSIEHEIFPAHKC